MFVLMLVYIVYILSCVIPIYGPYVCMFIKFWDNLGDPSCFPTPLPMVYTTFPSAGIRKRNKCKSFLHPIFSGRTTPTFLTQIVSAIYRLPFGKAWLSSICWFPSAKPGNEVECRSYGGWVIYRRSIWSRLSTKVYVVSRRCRWPLVRSQRTCPLMYIMFHPEGMGR